MSRKTTVLFVLFVLFVLAGAAARGQMPAPSPDKKASEVFKNVQVLKDIPSDQLIPAMQFITSSLGVRCEYCHVERAFDKDDKKTKQTARKMMQMMFAIDANNFEGKQQVTCYSCHRGNPKPLAIPLISETQPVLINEAVEPDQADVANLPSADAIIEKYVAAVGGPSAIAALKSLVEAGTFQAGGREFPVDLFRRTPDRIATVTHWPNGDGITEFDGKAGWSSLPGSQPHPMTPAEVDASRMDANLQFPVDIKKNFSELRVGRMIRIANQDAVMVTAKRSNAPDVEMYFDTQSGLLIRIIRFAASPLGLNPTQIDYSDYRDVSGAKLPFQWTSATPTGRYSMKIDHAEVNVAIPDSRFQKP